jgi:3-dehydroquinate synthase
MTKIQIKLPPEAEKTCQIQIEKGISNEIPKYLNKAKLGQKYAIITDSKVKRLYGNVFLRFLKKNGIEGDIFSFPDGEKSKRLETIEKLAEEMVNKKFDRKDAIIALGGGVVGDIAGLLASLYMRGIPYIQVPTTLLSMVDSSVGGKTGVDLECGKNLIGTFNQAEAVFIDNNYLKTLSIKQIRNGMAEVVKYGVIKDEKLFNFIEQNHEAIISLENKSINKIISESLKIKAKIVEEDEKEAGKRMILNYGHSYGHAIERMSDYKLLHGYAISIGMVLANKIATKEGILDAESAKRIKKLLTNLELPTVTMKNPRMEDLINDKKRSGNEINLILPKKIGEAIIHKIKCQ